MCASWNPGTMQAPREITSAAPTRSRTSSSVPTATIRSPRIATALAQLRAAIDRVDVTDDDQVRALAHGGGRYHDVRRLSVDQRCWTVHPVGVVPREVARELPPAARARREGERGLDGRCRPAPRSRPAWRRARPRSRSSWICCISASPTRNSWSIGSVFVDDEPDGLAGRDLQGSQVEVGEVDRDVHRAHGGGGGPRP